MLILLIDFASLLDEQWSLNFLMQGSFVLHLLVILEFHCFLIFGLIPYVLPIMVMGDVVDNVVDIIVDYGDISFRLRRKVSR